MSNTKQKEMGERRADEVSETLCLVLDGDGGGLKPFGAGWPICIPSHHLRGFVCYLQTGSIFALFYSCFIFGGEGGRGFTSTQACASKNNALWLRLSRKHASAHGLMHTYTNYSPSLWSFGHFETYEKNKNTCV